LKIGIKIQDRKTERRVANPIKSVPGPDYYHSNKKIDLKYTMPSSVFSSTSQREVEAFKNPVNDGIYSIKSFTERSLSQFIKQKNDQKKLIEHKLEHSKPKKRDIVYH